jgi:ubiquinone/menaquinone biosynthesis C-methylase UbiE
MLDYDAIANDYAKHRNVNPEVLRALLNASSWTETSRLLEVGCGTGNYLAALHHAIECECTGIDPSEQMLEKARARWVRARLLRGRAEQIPCSDSSFDFVFSVDVIHHVSDRAAHYREAFRVLASGGKACTVTDSEEIIRQRQPLSVYFPETVEVELARYPRVDDLRRMMSGAGFNAIHEVTVEFASTTTDIDAYRDKAFSSLHLISSESFERGIRQMEADLRKGSIPCVSRYVLLWGTK